MRITWYSGKSAVDSLGLGGGLEGTMFVDAVAGGGPLGGGLAATAGLPRKRVGGTYGVYGRVQRATNWLWVELASPTLNARLTLSRAPWWGAWRWTGRFPQRRGRRGSWRFARSGRRSASGTLRQHSLGYPYVIFVPCCVCVFVFA